MCVTPEFALGWEWDLPPTSSLAHADPAPPGGCLACAWLVRTEGMRGGAALTLQELPELPAPLYSRAATHSLPHCSALSVLPLLCS